MFVSFVVLVHQSLSSVSVTACGSLVPLSQSDLGWVRRTSVAHVTRMVQEETDCLSQRFRCADVGCRNPALVAASLAFVVLAPVAAVDDELVVVEARVVDFEL